MPHQKTNCVNNETCFSNVLMYTNYYSYGKHLLTNQSFTQSHACPGQALKLISSCTFFFHKSYFKRGFFSFLTREITFTSWEKYKTRPHGWNASSSTQHNLSQAYHVHGIFYLKIKDGGKIDLGTYHHYPEKTYIFISFYI